jgi:hypothetical protein
MRHDLKSGAWVEMRPVQDLKVRDREVYEAPLLDFEVSIGANGKPDMSGRKFSLKVPQAQKRALLCRLLTAWSFELPRPSWAGGIENEESFSELALGDYDEITTLLDPYITKISQKPDPKGSRRATTTASNGSSTTTGRDSSRPA